ncbi:MAG: hypothetical protein KI793_25145 [Rivularia sp. (in: Bacteria)]|nr:hypothetical protein [Rivularia sp. MS3]
MVERQYTEGAYLGIGYNSLTGEFRNTAVKVDNKNVENNQGLEREILQKVYFSYEHITNEEMLANSVGISGSAFSTAKAGFDFSNLDSAFESSINAGASKSFSAKASFLKRKNWNSSYTYVLLRCVVENEKYRINNPTLTDEALDILNRKDGVSKFREKFGDEFVVGFSTGGEYFALIEASSSEQESQTNFAADIRAEVEHYVQKYVFKAEHEAGMKIGGGVNNFQRNKKMNIGVTAYRAGCEDIGHAFIMSIEKIVQEISSLPAYVKKTGGIKFSSIFSDYGIMIGDKDNQIMSKELRRQKSVIVDLANKKKEDFNKLIQIELKLENANNDFKSLLIQEKEVITRRMYEINKYARQCIDNPKLIDDEVLRDLLIWN